MVFRIGINVGDILHKDNCIYGDGVNVAARIESLADPGGICISRGVFDQVKKKVSQGFEYIGERAVKNISNPVRIYKILTEKEYAGKVIGEKRFLGWMSRKLAMLSMVALAIVTGGLISYIFTFINREG
jgi:adenylate cyclase